MVERNVSKTKFCLIYGRFRKIGPVSRKVFLSWFIISWSSL